MKKSNFTIFHRILLNAPYSNLDVLYGPYTGITEACNKLLPGIRQKGLTVGIIEDGVVNEYWWQSGVTNNDLVPKLGNISKAISDEESNRITGDTALNAAITGEIASRISGDTALNAAITGEIASRISEDTALNAAITGEIASRISGYTYLYNLITGETSDRIISDTEIYNFITGETENLITKYNDITNKLNKVKDDVTGETYNNKNIFQSDFTVQLLTGSFGKYKNGDIVPSSGKTAIEVILDAAIQYLTPSFISFYGICDSIVEVGTLLPTGITFEFKVSNSNNILPNSLSIIDVTNNRLINDLSINSPVIVNIGSIKKTNNLDYNIWRANFINSNNETSYSPDYKITWKFKNFYGSSDTQPINSNDIRSLQNSNWYDINNFTINLNKKNYTIAIPNNKTLFSVITSNNENITNNFIIRNTQLQLNLADGITTQLYKVYDFTSATIMGITANVILN